MQAGGICPMSGPEELDRIRRRQGAPAFCPRWSASLKAATGSVQRATGCVRTGRMGGARLPHRPLSAAVSFREEPLS